MSTWVHTFDFRLHSSSATRQGTQYFEFTPGRYQGRHWCEGARFVDEYTFCLFEGIVERHLDGFDHYGFIDVPRAMWQPVLADWAALRLSLAQAANGGPEVAPPFGATLAVEADYRVNLAANQRDLAVLLAEMEDWLSATLRVHDTVCLLGL